MSIFDMKKLKDKEPEEEKTTLLEENNPVENVEEDADIELKGNISDIFTEMMEKMYPNSVVKSVEGNAATEGMAASISPEVISKAEKKRMKIYVTSVQEVENLGILEATDKLKDISPSDIDGLYIENVEDEEELNLTLTTYVDYARGKGFNVFLRPEELPKSL